MKSYAEAVRAQHPRVALAVPDDDDDDDDWTDVSSMASCSWPSCASETDAEECRDECLPTRDQSQSDYWTHDDLLLVAVDDMDGRGQRARTSTINHAHRATRLNNEINYGCINVSKPWRPILDYSDNYRRLLAMEKTAKRKKKRRDLKRETSNMAGSA